MVVWQQGLNFPISILLCFVVVQQMAAKGLSDKMVSEMEMHMKPRWVIKLHHVEKMAPIDFIDAC